MKRTLKRWVALLCAACLTFTLVAGGIYVGASESVPYMQAGDIAYMDDSQQNPFATAHGDALQIVDDKDKNSYGAWCRKLNGEYFGVVPSFGYAVDTQHANYLADETGVYYRMQAGLQAEIAVGYYATYGKTCYDKMRLFWSTDPEAGNWTALSDYEVVTDGASLGTAIYTVQLPDAATAGADVVYLDVRFPIEGLASNGATSGYKQGGLQLTAVRAVATSRSLSIMKAGDVAYMDENQQNPYAMPHGDALQIVDDKDKNSYGAWCRKIGGEYFGVVPSFGYAVDTQHANYFTEETGVYYRVQAGLQVEFTVGYHPTYGANCYDNMRLFWSTDPDSGNWTAITEYTSSTTEGSLPTATYVAQLPTMEEAGSNVVYFDIRFPVEDLASNGVTAGYKQGGLQLTAVRAVATSRSLTAMREGDVAYMDANQQNPYAMPHGEALVTVDDVDKTSYGAWCRNIGAAYFGVVPSFGYAVDTQHANYFTEETGVYFSVEAGLQVEFTVGYHPTYGANCYDNMRLFWSVNPESGNWTAITEYEVSTTGGSLPTGTYVVQLPTAAEAGSDVIYFDIRFPLEELASNGATSGYKQGGLQLTAVRAIKPETPLTVMLDGDVAYMNADQVNPYAKPHGEALVIVDDVDKTSYGAWCRKIGGEYFGIVPSFGYAVDTQHANYLADETGVYYRMQAGLQAEIAVGYYATYGKTCYDKMRLFWSTDPEAGNWTALSDYEVVTDGASLGTAIYTVQLPDAATAGADVVYLDVRFPIEGLASNGATSGYKQGGLQLTAVRAIKPETPLSVMQIGDIAYMNADQINPYARPHGEALVLVDDLDKNSSGAWCRNIGASYFDVIPAFGYAVDTQHANYFTDETGVYFAVQAGLKVEFAMGYLNTYGDSCYDNMRLFWTTDPESGNWTAITEYKVATTGDRLATAIYSVQLPSAEEAGAEVIYFDIRFPVEELASNGATSGYKQGGLQLTAVRASKPDEPLSVMHAGDVAYLDRNSKNPYAQVHGASVVVIKSSDPQDAGAWVRNTGAEYFGIIPTYSYAFDTQNSKYFTEGAGVYFCMQAGLKAEVAVAFHNTYAGNCFDKMKLYWTTDPDSGNWIELTDFDILCPAGSLRTATYVVQLPSAVKAGSDVVYLDVRFPTEGLYSDGNSSAYRQGAMHLTAVRAVDTLLTGGSTMTDGTVAVLDFAEDSDYSESHGSAIRFYDLLNDTGTVIHRTPSVAYFGSGYAPSFGYCVEVRSAGYKQNNAGVIYKIESGLYATVAIQYNNKYTTAVDNFRLYITADPLEGEWTQLEAQILSGQKITEETSVVYYTVKLPDEAASGSKVLFLDVRFPVEDLGFHTSVYGNGHLHIAAVKTTAEKPDPSTIHNVSIVEKTTYGNLVSFTAASDWQAQGAELAISDGALKLQAAGDFQASLDLENLRIPYGAKYTYLTFALKASGIQDNLVLRLSDASQSQWVEFDIAATGMSATDVKNFSFAYADAVRTSAVVDYSQLTRLTISGKAMAEGAVVELHGVKRQHITEMAELAIAEIEDITGENYLAQKQAIESARNICNTLMGKGFTTATLIYQSVPNYARLLRAEELYNAHVKAETYQLGLDLSVSASNVAAGSSLTATVTANALDEAVLPNLTVKFSHSYFVVSTADSLEQTIAGGAASGQASINLTANEGGVAMITVEIYDENGALLYTETIRVFVSGVGYYSSDSHNHSIQSDGQNTLTENFLTAYNRGLGFIITADHNAVVANDQDVAGALANIHASGMTDFLAIKMSELTGNYGHALQYGTKTAYSYGTSAESWQTIYDSIIAEGGAFYMAHPFYEPFLYPGLEKDPTRIDAYTGFTGVEVLNTASIGKVKEVPVEVLMALEYLDRMNIKGEQKYFGISNSDGHASKYIGDGISYFLLDEMTEDNIMAALKNGSFYGTNGPQLRFSIGGAQMGETLDADEGTTTTIYVAAADEASYITKVTLIAYSLNAEDNNAAYEAGERIVLYSDDGTQAKSFVELTKEIEVKHGMFYRVEVESACNPYLRFAFSNPIWTAFEPTGIVRPEKPTDPSDPSNPENPESSYPDLSGVPMYNFETLGITTGDGLAMYWAPIGGVNYTMNDTKNLITVIPAGTEGLYYGPCSPYGGALVKSVAIAMTLGVDFKDGAEDFGYQLILKGDNAAPSWSLNRGIMLIVYPGEIQLCKIENGVPVVLDVYYGSLESGKNYNVEFIAIDREDGTTDAYVIITDENGNILTNNIGSSMTLSAIGITGAAGEGWVTMFANAASISEYRFGTGEFTDVSAKTGSNYVLMVVGMLMISACAAVCVALTMKRKAI